MTAHGEHLDQLPAILAELDRMLEIHAGHKCCGVFYTCNPSRQTDPHLIRCWTTGSPDREFLGATFGEAYRPCYDFVRRDPPAARGEAEYDSWIEDFADMAGGGADLGRPGFYNLQTRHSGLADYWPLSAEEREAYHWPDETRWGRVPSRGRAHEAAQ